MTRCVFSGLEAVSHTENWAIAKGYLDKDINDMAQIRENKLVVDGNDAYWTLNVDDQLISIRR
jgi:hypothetical protein